MEYDNETRKKIDKRRTELWHPLESKKFMKEFSPRRIFTDELLADPCDTWGNTWWWHFPSWHKTGHWKTDF